MTLCVLQIINPEQCIAYILLMINQKTAKFLIYVLRLKMTRHISNVCFQINSPSLRSINGRLNCTSQRKLLCKHWSTIDCCNMSGNTGDESRDSNQCRGKTVNCRYLNFVSVCL